MNLQTVLPCLLGVLTVSAFPTMADEAAIKEIRKLYGKIVSGKPTKTAKIEFNLEDDPMEGEITRRTFDGGLTAIALSYVVGDHGGASQYFYYDGDGVFFILSKETHWMFGPDSTAEKPTSIDTLTETRCYLADGACIRLLKRSASSSDADKLEALIAKAPNEEVEPDAETARMIRRAKALAKITTAAEAAKFFTQE